MRLRNLATNTTSAENLGLSQPRFSNEVEQSVHLRRTCLNNSTGRHYAGAEKSPAYVALFHKLLLTRPPPLDSCLFPFASMLSGRSMRKPHQLILLNAHTSKYINSFFYRSSLVWNTLPADIQDITCNQTFKKEIEKKWSAQMHSTQLNPT